MLIIFDLDGTLIDSSKDLAISMNATREHFGLPSLDPNLIYSYVGNGAAVLVQKAMGSDVPSDSIPEALKFFLSFYRAHALQHTRLYPGIRELVEKLSQVGHKLAVLTNKPAKISIDIVAALGIQQYFMRVYGGDSFTAKKPDPIGVIQLLREAAATPRKTLLVGDSGVDVQTARNARVQSCGVLWGFQPGAFKTDPPDFAIADPRQLLENIGLS